MTVTRKSAKRSTSAGKLNDNLNALLDESTETEEIPDSQIFDDANIAELLANEAMAGQFRHAKGLGWLAWNGKQWRECPDKDPREAARKWVMSKSKDAADSWKASLANRQDLAQAEAIMKGWKRYLAKTKLDAIVALASGIEGVTTEPGDFDANPDLLNTQSGVVDLTTGELQLHDPDLLMTKVTRAKYEPGAEHPDWKMALDALPADVLGWYQIRLGQAITGHTPPDDVMLVQQGGGENGKTTIMGSIERVLGGYYLFVPHRALLADTNAHSTEITEFRGARFAVLEELPEERRLNVTRLKMLVGTPTLTGRKIFQDTITWDASHTLIVNTNYKPGVEETDHGTWRRLSLLHFPYRFVSNEDDVRDENDRLGDTGLRQRLRQSSDGQAEAVLAWLVAGAVEWYASNQELPEAPQRVLDDTRDWRADNDVLLGFLSEEMEADDDSYVLAEDLYEAVRTYIMAKGHKPWSDKTITARMDGHEMVRELRMEKKKIRPRQGRSLNPGGFDIETREHAGLCSAWLGARFAEDKSADRKRDSDSPRRTVGRSRTRRES